MKKRGDFLLVLPVKKEKNSAPQAPTGGREGTGTGYGRSGGSLASLTIFGGARGAEYKLIDESKLSRTRTLEAEKKLKKGGNACTRVYRRLHHCSRPAPPRRRRRRWRYSTHVPRHSRRNDTLRTGDRAARAACVRLGLLVEGLRT